MKSSPMLSRDQQQLVVDNLGLVNYLAGKLHSRSIAGEDLIAWGRLGLVEAARRYDAARGMRFTTYAAWWCRAYMLDAIMRDCGVSGGKQVRMVFWRIWHDTPSAELAETCGLDRRDVEALRAAVVGGLVRLDDPLQNVDIAARVPTPLDEAISAEALEELRAAIEKLSPRLRRVLRMRFCDEPKTFEAIGAQIGCSRETARKDERDALVELRRQQRIKELAP